MAYPQLHHGHSLPFLHGKVCTSSELSSARQCFGMKTSECKVAFAMHDPLTMSYLNRILNISCVTSWLTLEPSSYLQKPSSCWHANGCQTMRLRNEKLYSFKRQVTYFYLKNFLMNSKAESQSLNARCRPWPQIPCHMLLEPCTFFQDLLEQSPEM